MGHFSAEGCDDGIVPGKAGNREASGFVNSAVSFEFYLATSEFGTSYGN